MTAGTTYKYDYDEKDSTADAEFILETILFRQNWSVGVRDNLAAALMKVAYKKPLFDKREETKRKAKS